MRHAFQVLLKCQNVLSCTCASDDNEDSRGSAKSTYQCGVFFDETDNHDNDEVDMKLLESHDEDDRLFASHDEVDRLLKNLFALLDLNVDGKLEEPEIVKLSQTFVVLLLKYGEQANLQDVEETYRTVVQERFNAQGEAVDVTSTRFREFMLGTFNDIHIDKVAQQRLLRQWIQDAQEVDRLLKNLFDLHDLDDDGKLTEHELVKLNQRLAVHKDEQANIQEVEEKYRTVFRKRFNANGEPVDFACFRECMLSNFDIHMDMVKQQSYLQQWVQEARNVHMACSYDIDLRSLPGLGIGSGAEYVTRKENKDPCSICS